MATRIALVACTESTQGPWTLAKGNESGIKISCLGEGERVSLEVESNDTSGILLFDQAGSFPLQLDIHRKYRVSKVVNDGVRGSPTTVEIVLNAKT